jgi:hypothetical protein
MIINDGFKVVEAYLASIADRNISKAVYRGHANEEWKLIPAAFRGPVDNGIKTHKDLRRWKEMAARFADRQTTDLEWLVLAQHYGVATTLLDWSTNPLVALYFACAIARDRSSGTLPNGSVHMLPGEALPNAPTNRGWDPLEPYSGAPLLIDTLVMNPRTLAQDSVMTLHQESTSQATSDFQSQIFTVKSMQKRPTLDALKLMGISSDRIFVDIGVVAREFTDELTQAAAIRALRLPTATTSS